MISRREFMAGSVALAASSASKRLAPEPESILVNDIHSQLNPTRVLGISQPRSLEDVQSLVCTACHGRAAVWYRHLTAGYSKDESSATSGSQEWDFGSRGRD